MNNDYIWIEDAAREYNRSAAWFYKQLQDGTLTRYTFPGDRRVYLSRKEVEAYLSTPRAEKG